MTHRFVWRSPTRRVALGVAVVLVGLTAGCSADGETDSAPTTAPSGTDLTAAVMSLAEWQRQTTLVCEEYEPQQDAIVAAHPSPSTPDDVVALFDALTPIADRYIDALAEIEVPAERSADVERTYELNAMNGEAAARARIAAASGDQAGFTSAASAIESQSAELEALLVDLGVPACVSD
jgi:hypothetical protein